MLTGLLALTALIFVCKGIGFVLDLVCILCGGFICPLSGGRVWGSAEEHYRRYDRF
jgi:hypothetical protein